MCAHMGVWVLTVERLEGLVQAWVDQNETFGFRFETTCNRYISPGSPRTHFSSLSKLF